MFVTGHNAELNTDSDMKPDLCMYYEEVGKGPYPFTLPPHVPQGSRRPLDVSSAETQSSPRTSVEGLATPFEGSPIPVEVPLTPVESISTPVEGPSTPMEPEPPFADTRKKYVSENLKKTRPFQARVAWAWITTFIEIKHDSSYLAYDVNEDGSFAYPNTDHAMEARAQIIKYVAEIFARQHRQFVFAAMIVRRRAFLMRWDRAGAVVAKPFDYVDEPEKLLRFVYRIALAERSAQGYDPTASLASEEEIGRFRAYRDALSRDSAGTLLEYVDKILAKDTLKHYPIYKVSSCPSDSVATQHPLVEQLICEDPEPLPSTTTALSTAITPDATPSMTTAPDPGRLGAVKPTNAQKDSANPPNAPRTHAFLVGYPRHCTRAPTGRGGKGFVAYDVDRDRCSFLKDYWYDTSNSVHPETEVYQRLQAKKVPHVATLVAGHDVASQETLTQNYLMEEGRPSGRRHHRFVVEEIGRPLETYKTARQLCLAVLCALLGETDDVPLTMTAFVNLPRVQATVRPGKMHKFCTGI